MGILSRIFTKKAPEPVKKPAASDVKTVCHKVAGTSYRQKAIQSLGKKNPYFDLTKAELFKRYRDETVYEYTFNPRTAELVPEPDNPQDPNAIKVLVDGVHVGYIKAGSCAHIHKLLEENRILQMEPRIIGGRSKMLCTSDADAKRLEDYELVRGTGHFGVQLFITETAKKPGA